MTTTPGPRCEGCPTAHPTCAGQVDPVACSLIGRPRELARRSAWESSLRGWPGPAQASPRAIRPRVAPRPCCGGMRPELPPAAPSLGIGIITRNRLGLLRDCFEAILKHTETPFKLVVADDGSSDGTAEWCEAEGIERISGERKGCAWTKNRALLSLYRAGCDPIITVEEDTRPVKRGWEKAWIEGARRWGFLNACADADAAEGEGTPESPKWGGRPFGQWHAITRAELERVGYLDTRFYGYGWEHVAWTWRFPRENPNGWRPGKLPLILPDVGGVEFRHSESHCDAAENDANQARYWDAVNAPLPEPFGHTEADRSAMEAEWSRSVSRDRALISAGTGA